MAEAIKVKAKAIHHIHHGGEKYIQTGETFSAPKDQIDRLVALGAAEEVGAEAKSEPVESAEAKAAREAAEKVAAAAAAAAAAKK
jgi:hypothetical protein